LLILVLAYSGNPALGCIFPIEPQLICLALLVGFLLFRRAGDAITPRFAGISLVYILILLVQCLAFSFCPVVTMAGFLIRLFIGYAAFRIIHDFPRTYVHAMYGLAVTSLIFYFPYAVLSLVGVAVEASAASLSNLLRTTIASDTSSIVRYPLLLHTFVKDNSLRNLGMFWEPGAFGGYLILAVVFLSMCRSRMDRRMYLRYLGVTCIAILTTLSTTAYVALPLALALHFNWHLSARKHEVLQKAAVLTFFLPLFLVICALSYNSLDFLRPKIESQLDAVRMRQGSWHRGRMGSIIFDWEYIKRRPLSGWGLHSKTRYALHPWMEDSQGMGNGMSDFTVRLGLVGMATWLIGTFLGLLQLSGQSLARTIWAIVIILLVLQGEIFLGYPCFLGLMFLGGPRRLRTVATFRVRRPTVRKKSALVSHHSEEMQLATEPSPSRMITSSRRSRSQ